ncbi:MAG: YeiH family protein [Chloroflexia bacterium]
MLKQPTNTTFGFARWSKLAPGVGLSAVIGLVAWGVQVVEEWVIGHAIIEALVVAILLGTGVRTFWKPTAQFTPGIGFSAKQLLEFAIVLLGASVSLPVLLEAGAALIVAIVLLVVFGITASLTIGRLLGLNPKLATLVAVGNSICGNSAIAAVAPVIGASAEDIASSIAITAVIGVVMVLGLPLLIPLLQFSFYQYGVLAGMTVYAVPQVLAATFPVSTLSGQIGTLVKLVRVLMLGPVVVFFALRFRSGEDGEKKGFSIGSVGKLVPWFIVGFILLAGLRSVGLLPAAVADPVREVSRWLTIAAMAALGLGVDIRAVGKVGRPVALAVVGSLVSLLVVAIGLIWVLGIR